MQAAAGSGGQTSSGAGGFAAGSGGQAGTAVVPTLDASSEAGPAGEAGMAAEDASTKDQQSVDANLPFILTSTAFKDREVVPPVYRCTDQNVSPPLSWTPGPAGTQSYAVDMVHVAADMSIHWAMWDIPANVTSLPMGVERASNPTVPAGSKQAKPGIDGSTWFGYTGPCPGSAGQQYEFSVRAIDVATLPGVTVQSTTADVVAAMQAHALKAASLDGGASK
jgi:Raf kinase inhibitor-like YbhB/YbcL family protein